MTDTTDDTATDSTDTEDDTSDSDSDTDTDSTDTDSTDTDDESDDDESDDAATDEAATSGPDPRLLEELDQHIKQARAAAEEAMGDSGYTFEESGDEESEDTDDQTVAPPG